MIAPSAKILIAALIPLTLLSTTLAATPAKLPPVTRVGRVTLAQSVMNMPGMPAMVQVVANASFVRSPAQSASLNPRDFCALLDTAEGSSGLPGVSPSVTAVKDPVSLDAGNPLTLRAAQPYTTLPRQKQGKVYTYAAGPLPRALPPKLLLDIPGAPNSYPAMRGVTIPDNPTLKFTAPGADLSVTPTSTLKWSNALTGAGSLVMFTAMQADGDLILSCTAIDDGSFTIPQATSAEMKRRGFTEGQLTTVARVVSRSVQKDDAQLIVQVTTSQTMMPEESDGGEE